MKTDTGTGSNKDISSAIEYINSFQFHGFRLGLERMDAVLSALGMPHKRYPVIHVAGSNGKGSTCATISSILTTAGYRCGFYSSPHLFRLNERFQINGSNIPDQELADLIFRIRKLVEAGYALSYFEYTTAIAFTWFAAQNVDLAILETGLGGRLDATNVVNSPLMSIITTVSLEHQHWLGDTVGEIAWEKAGIIKPERPVITCVKEPEAAKVISNRASKLGAPLYSLGRDFSMEKDRDNGLRFRFREHTMPGLTPGLPGRHQEANAAAALASVSLLREQGFEIEESQIRAGLSQTSWPCRCELLSRRPYILIDGAHNREGLHALAEYIKKLSDITPFSHCSLLWACSNEGGDKPFLELLGIVGPLFHTVTITEPPGPRSPVTVRQWERAMAENISSEGQDVTLTENWERALYDALEHIEQDGLLVVAGSLYLAGAVREKLVNEMRIK